MRFLSEEFLAQETTVSLPRLAGGFDGRVRATVEGGPEGRVQIVVTFQDGRCVGWELGAGRGAELVLTFRHQDALALLAGDRDLNALFISGDMKTDGPTGPLLDLIVAVCSEDGRALLAELDEATTER